MKRVDGEANEHREAKEEEQESGKGWRRMSTREGGKNGREREEYKPLSKS